MATKQTNIRIEKELLDRYEALGAANDRTGSYYIRKAVESFELVQDKPKVVAKIKKEVAVKSYVESPKPLKMKSDSDEVIDYLNLRAGTKYRYSKASRDCIEPRLKEFSIDDCKAVIDKKCNEWLGTENAKYLRPETLFRVSKFEGYLNQIVATGGVRQDELNDTDWAVGLDSEIGQSGHGGAGGQLSRVEEFGSARSEGECFAIQERVQAPTASCNDREQHQLGFDDKGRHV